MNNNDKCMPKLTELNAQLVALDKSDAGDDNAAIVASDEDETSSESSVASAEEASETSHENCTSCDSKYRRSEIFLTLCGHHYCPGCLHTLFDLSIKNETLFPTRCCQVSIPLDSARPFLSATLAQKFLEKRLELSTPDRTYCSRSTCSSFIPPAEISTWTSTATCFQCLTATCTICKGPAHDGNCPPDVRTQLVLDVARQQGWQRCYNCRHLVERDNGCNQIT